MSEAGDDILLPLHYYGQCITDDPQMVLSGRLRGEARGIHPVVAGRGKTGPLQLKVSRTHTPPSTTTHPHYTPATHHHRENYVERLWAYLTVQVCPSVPLSCFIFYFVLFVCFFSLGCTGP